MIDTSGHIQVTDETGTYCTKACPMQDEQCAALAKEINAPAEFIRPTVLTYKAVEEQIAKFEKKIKVAEDDLQGMKSPSADAMRATLAIMKDLIKVLRALNQGE